MKMSKFDDFKEILLTYLESNGIVLDIISNLHEIF